ncbi:PQQ-like beta-propeller repeat protein [Anaplasma capra]|nr:PQQ-like beta-propeller repeat protein [Anaplasma capra]
MSERFRALSAAFVGPEIVQTFSRVRNVAGVSGVTIPPVVADGLVVVLDEWGKLTALNEGDLNNAVWYAELAEGVDRVYSGGLAYSNGMLLCAVDNLLYGIDLKNGKVKWKKVLRNPLSGNLVTLNDGEAVAALVIDNYLYVFNVADGGLLWHHEGVSAHGVRMQGTLSVAYSRRGNAIVVLFPDGKVLCLDAHSGDKIWEGALQKRDLGIVGRSVVSPVVVAREVLLVGGSGVVESVELSSGKKVWSADVGACDVFGVEKVGVFVLTRDGKLLAFDIESKIQLWASDLGKIKRGGWWNSPVLAAGKLWLLGSDGRLLGINPLSGTIEESYKISGFFARSFAVAKNVAYAPAGKQGLVVLS